MCGLKEETLGKPGLQEQNCKLWIEARKEESSVEEIFLSLSIDGKKIAVKPDGIEDMGGVGDESRKKKIQNDDQERKKLVDFLKINDRMSLFSLFDSLTVITSEISKKLTGILKLIEKNSRQLKMA